MAVAHKISIYDEVELRRPIDAVPVGATGAVLELRDGDVAMVEITEPHLDALDRIVFVALADLRLLH